MERFSNDITQWRGIATRYDELAITHRDGVVVGAIVIRFKSDKRQALAVKVHQSTLVSCTNDVKERNPSGSI